MRPHPASRAAVRRTARFAVLSLSLVAAGALHLPAAEADGLRKGGEKRLLVNGDFADGLTGWDVKGKAAVQTLDARNTLSVTSGGVVQSIALDPAWRALRLALRFRAVAVVPGDPAWKTARLAMCFYGADGQQTGGWPNVFASTGTTDWADCQRDYAIPTGAVRLELTPANFGASGRAEFQDLRLEVVAAPPAPSADPLAAKGPAPSGKSPIILLKLDDVGHWVSPRWQRVADHLAQRHLKASFGIIGQGLEKAGPETVKWIQERHQSGMVEFWNHGYKARTATDTGEFEQGTADEQRAILEKTQELARTKLGFELRAFGPHWSGTTLETEKALEAIPSLQVWYYGPAKPTHFTRRSIPRVMALENPTFVPDFEKFKATYEKHGHRQEVLVLQGHPDAWGDASRWAGFVQIVEFLQSKGCVFMTPSEYLARDTKPEGDLFPFVIPWDDALQGVATDVSFLNDAPAGKHGPILAKDGQFVERDTGRRVRFFGVNLCGPQAFPDPADATLFAKRLAKAGVNIARLHHLDNSWNTPRSSIWDTSRADRQHFDPRQLDRLDFLVDQLKRNGIYVNINLKVSKHLSAADGLPESIAKVPFLHQKRIDFFQRRMIDLQKDYARQLLTHRNPYTGLTYAEEPAVACVELNNENSLLGFWTSALGRGLDTLPEPFLTELADLWTAWLRQRYHGTEALRAAWMEGVTPPGASILSAANRWTFESHAPSVAELVVVPSAQPDGAPGADVAIQKNDPADWHIQAHLAGLTLVEGAMYTVTFRARAEARGAMRVNVRLDVDDWRNMGLETTVEVGPEPRDYTLDFRAARTVPAHARLGFMLGRLKGKVAISDVALSPGVKDAGLRDNETLATRVRVPGATTARQEADWLAFLIDTERATADELRGFVRDELKVGAPLALSQIDYGGTAGMHREEAMDFADSHAYWQHPSFVNNDWNPNRWTIANSPQVSDFSDKKFGVLGRLAMARVGRKPFTVSEYDHPAPSDYACEMLPELGSFAALQDWDGIYTFAVSTYAATNAPDRIQGFFDQNNHPAKWAFYPTAALLFRQGLIPSAGPQTTLQLPQQPWQTHPFVEDAWRAANAPSAGFLAGRLAVNPRTLLPAGTNALAIGSSDPQPAGLSAELRKTPFGQAYVVAAPAAVVFAGFLGGGTLAVDGCELTVGEFRGNFAAVTAVALDGLPLKSSKRILATVCGRVENQNMGWNAERTTVGSAWGRGPTLAQRVPATLSLAVDGPRTVHALAPNGARAATVPTAPQDGRVVFSVRPEDCTLFYELTAE